MSDGIELVGVAVGANHAPITHIGHDLRSTDGTRSLSRGGRVSDEQP